ncbi:MAG: hypothetical protein HQL13_06775 [Candidatus Omnitrophica bacterium]|nr:hypothetical protein [Candidatus Omnitrophota bacterium]
MSTTILTFGLIVFALLCALLYLVYVLITKEDIIKEMAETNQGLLRSFNDLDEQAKLIIRTDLELNKIREEMDKRLHGLNALQRTARQMNQALNETEIFQRISPTLFEDWAFGHVLIASKNEHDILKIRLNVGYAQPKAEAILKEIDTLEFLQKLPQGTAILSSINSSVKNKEKLIQLFETEHFIFSPIITQNGNIGFVFVGNNTAAPAVTEADEELIAIFAGQIGQSIENAKLFEKVFRSSQQLELKVADRTKQLALALQKVNEISKKKSDFISAVSHELRTPLTSIKGYAAILMAGKIGDIPSAVKERLAKINTHSDNLVGLINNLLDIARIESGKEEMKFALYKIKGITDNVSDLLNPQISAKSIHLQINLPPQVEEIYVDSAQIERVFINLLSNAIKFTPQEGTITITVASEFDHGYALISVSDTGIGIPPEALQNLFNEFYRVDNEINQNVKGTGLGLVLAKNIVLAHHGKIWVQSKQGSGTTFYFTLPSSPNAFEEHLNPEKNYA